MVPVMSTTGAADRAGGPVVPGLAVPGGVEQTPGPLGPPADDQSWARAPAVEVPPVARHRRKRAGWAAVVVVVVVLAAGLGAADAAGEFGAPRPAASSNAYATSTATVRRGALTEQAQESGTLGSAGSYSVVVPGAAGSGSTGSSAAGSAAQTFTWLPRPGAIIRQGQVLYEINQTPVVLLYGSVPAYRDLSEGMTGSDVRELNTDLVRLGYATAAALGPVSGWYYFSSETAYAVGRLQSHLGLTLTGSLPLGEAAFLPTAIRVSGPGTGVVPGASAAAGSVVLTGSSLTPVVTVDMDASLQTEVAAGNKVSITLPDGTVTPGVISQITAVAASSSSAGGGSSSSASGNSAGGGPAMITVVVSLTDPQAAGSLSQVPVEVTITTGSVSGVLIVPVNALLSQPGGGYAVEVAGQGGHHLVSVTPGLFDDAAGTVQVTGNLRPGQRVVVPGS